MEFMLLLILLIHVLLLVEMPNLQNKFGVQKRVILEILIIEIFIEILVMT
jgi:hypothetical protein